MTAIRVPRVGSLGRRLPRVDARLVVGVLLVSLSVLGGLRLSGGGAHTVAVYAAAHDLGTGHVLGAADLSPVRVQVEAPALSQMVRVGVRPPVGHVLRAPLREGGIVPASALGGGAPVGRELTVAVTPEHALGGSVRAGDRVDVLASFDKSTDAAKTITVAASVPVVDVVRADGLFGQREGSISALTVRVDPDDAVFVVFALRNAEIDIVRSTRAADGVRERFDADELP